MVAFSRMVALGAVLAAASTSQTSPVAATKAPEVAGALAPSAHLVEGSKKAGAFRANVNAHQQEAAFVQVAASATDAPALTTPPLTFAAPEGGCAAEIEAARKAVGLTMPAASTTTVSNPASTTLQTYLKTLNCSEIISGTVALASTDISVAVKASSTQTAPTCQEAVDAWVKDFSSLGNTIPPAYTTATPAQVYTSRAAVGYMSLMKDKLTSYACTTITTCKTSASGDQGQAISSGVLACGFIPSVLTTDAAPFTKETWEKLVAEHSGVFDAAPSMALLSATTVGLLAAAALF